MRLELPIAERLRSAVYEATAELEFLAGDLATAVEAWEEVCRLHEEGG